MEGSINEVQFSIFVTIRSSKKADYNTYNEVLGLFEEFKVVLASGLNALSC